MKNVTILLAVLALAVPAYGATHEWTGADLANNYWNDGDNWDQPNPPTISDYVRINGSAYTVEVQNAASYKTLDLRRGTLNIHANINNGTATSDTRIGYDSDYAGDGSEWGIATQDGGTFAPAYHMYIGYANNRNSYGRYTISGGSLTGPGVRRLQVGRSATSTGTGELIIVGSGPSKIEFGYYVQNSTSTLELQFDGDGDPIQQIGITNNVTLAGTLKITGTASTTGGPNSDGEYVIMTYGGSLTGTWTEDLETGWSVAYGSGSVTATYVPEPATMVLLGLGGIGVLIRRKRR